MTMKKLSELTPDEKRVIVAEFEGYRHIGHLAGHPESFYFFDDIPNYLNDQNAIIAACGKLKGDERDSYANVLVGYLSTTHTREHGTDLDDGEVGFRIVNATAEQRTNALILTIGKATI